ncbi:MAG: hypothetical protein RR549_00435 [Oscillospiraceae bacterium]
MNNFYNDGKNLRLQIKQLVLNYMKSSVQCYPNNDGMKQAEIFRECGLDWGTYLNATSTNQQYWIVGLLRDLEKDGYVQKDEITKKWKIK